MKSQDAEMSQRSSSVIVLGYVAGTLGLITMLIFAMLMSALNGWAITFNFNLLGEAIVELFFLVAFFATGVVSLWKISDSLLTSKKE